MIDPFINLFIRLLSFYKLAIFIYIIMQWLLQFNVINYSNKFVQTVYDMLQTLIEPLLLPIRRTLQRIFPSMRQIDLSPILLILLVILVQELLFNLKVAI